MFQNPKSIFKTLVALGFAAVILFPVSAGANRGLEVSGLTVQKTERLFKYYNYEGVRGYLMLPSYHYPPLFFKTFPSDFAKLTDEARRQALFIKILTPQAMRLNLEISKERDRVEELSRAFAENDDLTKEQTEEVEALAKKYDIFTRLQGYRRYNRLLKELKIRVDEIPVSFLIALAAIETNWGTSRLVTDANSLYKTRVWHTNQGLKPVGETNPDEDYRYKIYPGIYESMRDFALKLNSDIAFYNMREFRARLRYQGTVPLGTTFAYTLVWNSPLKNYAGMLEYTIAFYELNVIDKSILNSKMIDKSEPENLTGHLKKIRY